MGGKNKLARFKELDELSRVIQPTKDDVLKGISLRGKWNSDFFKNENPIIVELGCGRGEYCTELGSRNKNQNFIGVDIKGARIWYGAKKVVSEKMNNVGFLRTRIEWIKYCFSPGEIDEIWITFPDPQIKFQRAKHRMVSPDFLSIYQTLLKPGGVIHLKSDSEFLHGYLQGIIKVCEFEIQESYHDIYNQLSDNPEHNAFAVKTFYEKIWIDSGKPINYLKFSFPD
jgi:tRNA (guanine-N7-)-methyltransferase